MRDPLADAEDILRAAIAASDPAPLVRHALEHAPELARAGAVLVIAVGKAACAMADAAQDHLRSRVLGSVTVVPHDVDCPNALHAAHPAPDHNSVTAAQVISATIQSAPPDALVLVLLSGGASALMALPRDPITIDEYAHCVRLLNRAGASITELNTVRKHIDALKGGRLALLAAPRRVLGLILSDVVDDPPAVIASGPLTPDPTTFADAIQVLHRYGLWESCAISIRAALLPLRGVAPMETPKSTESIANARIVIIGNNAVARAGAAAAARERGYHVIEITAAVIGEARAAGARLADEARTVAQSMAAESVCIIAGGETTVTVTGNGRGGRNQELVLAAALALEELPHVVVGSIGTDGIDGDSDAAGAVADAALLRHARSHGIEPQLHLHDNDSHGFFSRAGGHVRTGATGTNLLDVHVLLLPRAVG